MMKLTGILLKVVMVALLFGAFYYYFHNKVTVPNIPILETIKDRLFGNDLPCKDPIPYTLGTFDTQFGVSKQDFVSDLAQAEAIWEKPYGRDLFDYVASGAPADAVSVNLIYDYRQEATKELSTIGVKVDNTKASYDTMKTKLDSLKSEYDSQKAALSQAITDFNQKEADYNSEVDYWNSKGGASDQEYKKLEAERTSLQAESDSLKSESDDLDNLASEINALVTSINSVAKAINLSVTNYNSISDTRGDSFEEGVYKSDGPSREIDIYEFSNQDKLIRVLAHEMGHALGLEHVSDPQAIMYAQNDGSGLAATKADLDELASVCGVSK
ncbi:MAG TPA: matrixin family metalloprotease [Candidatus Paceibacterota bacterium]|nr:matrixin family metalloprotease [Candidatus Paceibacterota bacterium]